MVSDRLALVVRQFQFESLLGDTYSPWTMQSSSAVETRATALPGWDEHGVSTTVGMAARR